MKLLFTKIKSFTVLASIFVLLLQSYIFMYGCSSAIRENSMSADAASLYSSKCGSCHRLLDPQDYSASLWQYYVDKYGKKMTIQDKERVLNYLQQNAKDAQKTPQTVSH